MFFWVDRKIFYKRYFHLSIFIFLFFDESRAGLICQGVLFVLK